MVFFKYIFIIGFHIRPDFESCVGRFQITHWFSIPQVIHQVGEADTPKLKDLNPQHETDTQRVVVHTWCMKLEDHLPDYEYVQSTTDFWPTIWVHRFQPPFCLNYFEVGFFFSPSIYLIIYVFKHALDIIVWVKTASRAILPLYFFSAAILQFMSNYTSAAAFRQPNGETRWTKREKLNRTGESVAAG